MNKEKQKYRKGKLETYLGKRYGKLYIQECVEPHSPVNNDRGLWKGLCDCGNIKIVKGSCLRKNRGTESCGCSMREVRAKANHKRRNYDAEILKQYNSHKHQCIRRDLTPLKKDIWLTIVTQPCYYCGEVDKRSSLNSSKWVEEHSYCTEDELKRYEKLLNGVDRKDSTKNYIEGNVVSCCAQCNFMKIDYTEQEFFDKVSIIHNRHSYSDVSLESLLCN